MSVQESKGSKPNLNNHQLPILAVDFGERRFGIAISDSNGVVGSPIETIIKTEKRGLDGVMEDILKISEKNKVGSIMVGKPQIFEERHQKIVDKIENFGRELRKESGLEVWYYDESFSSKTALTILPTRKSRSRKKGSVDKMSAALFLQEYLNEKNKTRI